MILPLELLAVRYRDIIGPVTLRITDLRRLHTDFLQRALEQTRA